MKNSAYHCPYVLIDSKVNAIYIVYKIRDYDSTGTEHNYLSSCGMDDNHRGVCFLKDGKTMRVYGVAGSPYNYIDISNFPTSYFNPCRRDKWNVVCVVYDTTSGKSSLWVNHGKICLPFCNKTSSKLQNQKGNLSCVICVLCTQYQYVGKFETTDTITDRKI